MQEIAIAAWVGGGRRDANRRIDAMVRELGWVRCRLPDGSRQWVREGHFLALRAENPGYRRSGARKKVARMRMSAERRTEIARMGGLARRSECSV
jgi:hypothetical protein